jgi:uncharacterized protein involved in outer membrane biogenesis
MYWLKKIIYVLFSFVVILVLLAVVSLFAMNYMDVNKYKSELVSQFNSASGQTLVVDGPIDIKIFPSPYASLQNATLSMELGGENYQIKAQQADLHIPFKSFWSNKFDLQKFNLKNASIVHPIVGLPQPLNLTLAKGNFRSTCCSLALNDIELNFADGNTVKTDIDVSFLSKIPSIDARIEAKKIIISASDKNNSINKVIPREKLYFDFLGEVEGKISVNVDNLIIGDWKAANNIININLNKKTLDATHNAQIWSGDYTAKYSLLGGKSRSVGVEWDINIKQAKADEWLKAAQDAKSVRGGVLDFSFKGKSRGNSVYDWLSRTNGDLFMNVRDLTILEPHFKTSLGGLVFSSIAGAINKPTTQLKCAIAKLPIQNGIIQAKNTIGFETDKISGIATGSINLKTEAINLDMNLVPKPNIVDITDMTQSVHIGGTLGAPNMNIKAVSLIKQGGSLVLGVVTGGLSLLAEGVLEQITRNGNVCEQIQK